jgi:hypothetical protein
MSTDTNTQETNENQTNNNSNNTNNDGNINLPPLPVATVNKNPLSSKLLPSSTLTTGSTNPSTSPPDPSTSIFTFFIITLIYFISKYKLPDSMSTMLNIIYVIAIVSIQISINTALAKSVCNNPNAMNTGILATIFPMLFIFGLLEMLLTIFPGWLAPFSNTFGYGIAKLVGLQKMIERLIQPPRSGVASSTIVTAINNIYNDPSIFINQFNYDNQEEFDKTWDNSYAGGKGIFFPSAGTASSKSPIYNEFREFVKLKDIVGTFIWYMLVGVLVTSKSYNYIINQPCSLNPEVAEKATEKYMKAASKHNKTNKLPEGFAYDAS